MLSLLFGRGTPTHSGIIILQWRHLQKDLTIVEQMQTDHIVKFLFLAATLYIFHRLH